SGASSNDTAVEDIAAWSVGGIVGWGPVSLGGNYADNGDSGQPTGSGWESSYWNVAAGFETGPLYFSAGYMSSIMEGQHFGESTYEHIALTADYTVAPGLAVYAEINLIDEEIGSELLPLASESGELSNSVTSFVAGMAVKF
ncbi:MAG: porin, partial [Proteobacteria bacterium]|nr:porin [Pseudomonadota bacterium]